MKNIAIKIIKFYQRNISSWMSAKNIRCKYYPTCSEYTIQAIKKYGFFIGSSKGFIRICRCNPFSKGGYDPLK